MRYLVLEAPFYIVMFSANCVSLGEMAGCVGGKMNDLLFENERHLCEVNAAMAQILGHESLNTTSRYSQRNEKQLSEAADNLNY